MFLSKWLFGCVPVIVLGFSMQLHASEGSVGYDEIGETRVFDAVKETLTLRKGTKVLKMEDKDGSYEVLAKDKWNPSYKITYSAEGKIFSESKHKIPLSAVPAAVIETAKKWAPKATWAQLAEVETNKSVSTYAITGDLNEKIISAQINEDGSVVKADKLPD